jgi:autotransporter-associated beta strand protein
MKFQHKSRRDQRRFFHNTTNPSPSRGPASRRTLALSAAALVATSLSAKALRADVFSNLAAGGSNLNQTASWSDQTNPATVAIPASLDIAQFDSNSSGGTLSLGASTAWQGIAITNPAAAVTLGTAGDGFGLTLGTFGIDLSAAAQNLTIADNTTLAGSQTWNVSTAHTLTFSGTVATAGFTTTLAGAGNSSAGAAISGTGGIVMTGTGNLTLTKADTYSGGTTIQSGTVTLSTATSAGTGPINLSGGTLAFSGIGTSTVSNNFYATPGTTSNISCGSATITLNTGAVTGTGNINLSITGSGNDFSINNHYMLQNFFGVLSLGASTGYIREASGTTPYYLGGTLDLGTSTAYFNSKNGQTITLGALESTGTGTALYGATANTATTYSIGSLGASTVFAGSIVNGTGGSSATTALTLTGGTLALTGNNNTYTGATTITAGTLQIGNGSTSGSISAGAVTNNSVLAFNPGASGTFTIANAISGSGLVTHIGPGVTTLTGINSFTGGTNISSGTLQADNASNALGTGPVAVLSGGTLGGIGTIQAAVTVNSGGILAPGDLNVNHALGIGVGTLTVSSLNLLAGSALSYDLSATGNDLTNITTPGGLSVTSAGIYLYQPGTTSPLTTNGVYNLFNESGGASSVTGLLSVLNAQPSLTYTFGTSGNFVTLTIGGGSSATAWNNSAGSTWNNAANWTAGIPNAQYAVATLGSSPGITSPATITLNGNQTVGSLTFNNSTGNASVPPTSYTIAQGTSGSLIIDNGSAPASITDLSGTQLISAPVILNSNTGLVVTNAADTVTLSNSISGAGGITASGAGTLVLSGNNSFAGNLLVSSGTTILTGSNSAAIGSTTISTGASLQVGNGASTGTLPAGTVANAGTLTFNLSTGTTTVANNISGAGNLVQSGTGTTSLSGTNTYSGSTTINAGTLQLASTSALGTGALTINAGGALDINGFNTSIGSLSGGGLINNLAAGGTPLLTVGSAASTTFSGSINNSTGTVSLLKVGAGTFTLSGSSSYTGSTNISAGVLKIATGGVLNATGTLYDDLADGLVLGNGVTVANPIVFSGGSNEFVNVSDSGASATLAGNVSVLSTASQLRLGISGTGASVTVTGNESAGASIGILNRGNLIFSGSGSFNVAGGGLLVARAGATNLTLVNSAAVTSSTTISVGQAQSTAGTFVAQIQDNATFAAAGTFDLEAINVSGDSATYNLSGGTLAAGSFIKTYADTSHAATLNFNGGTLAALNNSSAFLPAFGGLTLSVQTNGALVNDNGFAITIAAPFTSAATPDGGFTKLGLGNISLSGTNTYNGGTNVSAGTLTFASPGAFPAFTKLNIAANATAVAANFNSTSPKNTLFTSSLTLAGASGAWTSKLDLSNNDLIVQNGNLSQLTNQVKQGYAGGSWQGSNGITSSAAATDSTRLHAIGVIPNQNSAGGVLYTAFDNATQSATTDVLLKYTYYGDTNLDGIVDGTDYSRIDTAFLTESTTHASLSGWYNGDFNYDGVVDGSDYTLIDNAYNSQGTPIAAEIATPTAELSPSPSTSTSTSPSTSAVPEPTLTAVLALSLLGTLGRRKRTAPKI